MQHRESGNTHVRMGTRMRGALADAYGTRGRSHAELTYAYSAKTGKDVVLRTSLEYGHFLLCEALPEIDSVDYGANASSGNEEPAFDAVVTFATGELQGRFIRAESESNLSFEIERLNPKPFVVMTEQEIYRNPVLIRNWNRVVPYLAQVRDVPLQNYIRSVAALIKSERIVSLRKVLNMGAADESAFYAAAAFRAEQKGILYSDLDSLPLSLNTQFGNGSSN